jgi:predicted CXXCH cytochrome family protein
MKKRLIIPFLIIASIIVVYAIFDYPHDFSREECLLCHVDYEQDPAMLTMPVSDICRRCHDQINSKSSHPVDIYPSTTTVPPDLPLRNGKITCSTCHNIHKESSNIFGEKSYFLRRPDTGRDFCITCHTQGISSVSHADTIDAAHIGSRFRVTDPSEPLDAVSKECISCHSGILGKTTVLEFGSGVWIHDNPEHSHPIGADYEESRIERKDAKLKPMPQVDKRINFFEGKVGCGSCHDIYSTSQMSLVMSNKGSKLCLACHEL